MDFKRRRGKATGVSIPVIGGGISWSSGTDERDAIRSLVIDLEARRALYGGFDCEGEVYVGHSVIWMRDRLSETLKLLVDDSDASQLVSHLREVCNTYLTTAGPDLNGGHFQPLRPHAEAALRNLRQDFRIVLVCFGQGGLDRADRLAERVTEETKESSSTRVLAGTSHDDSQVQEADHRLEPPGLDPVPSEGFLERDSQQRADAAAPPAKRWVHNYPASYHGLIWMQVSPADEDCAESVALEIRWGPWVLRRRVRWPARRHVDLWHTKGDDGLSIPIIIRSDRPVRVSFHLGPSPDDALDLNPGWQNDGL